MRELQHTIERAVILSSGYTISADDLILTPTNTRKAKVENLNLEDIERIAIEKALDRADGNMSQAAEILGISRYALYRKVEKMR